MVFFHCSYPEKGTGPATEMVVHVLPVFLVVWKEKKRDEILARKENASDCIYRVVVLGVMLLVSSEFHAPPRRAFESRLSFFPSFSFTIDWVQCISKGKQISCTQHSLFCLFYIKYFLHVCDIDWFQGTWVLSINLDPIQFSNGYIIKDQFGIVSIYSRTMLWMCYVT